jgi:hypothetical protein
MLRSGSKGTFWRREGSERLRVAEARRRCGTFGGIGLKNQSFGGDAVHRKEGGQESERAICGPFGPSSGDGYHTNLLYQLFGLCLHIATFF